MFSNHLKKHFLNNNNHYIVTDKKLSSEELNQLSQLLDSFPHCSKTGAWPAKFAKLNIEAIPKKLVVLAANAYDSNGNTVLGIAAEYGKVDAVQRLIDMGAELNTPDDNMQKLALHWAINNKLSFENKTSYDAVAVVKCLLDNGAKTYLTCYENSTPLDYAKSRGFKAAANLIEENMQRKLRL